MAAKVKSVVAQYPDFDFNMIFYFFSKFVIKMLHYNQFYKRK